MKQYETALKLWNVVFWISVAGGVVTLYFAGFFILAGVKVSWPIWVGLVFYLLGGVNAQICIKMIEKEMRENE